MMSRTKMMACLLEWVGGMCLVLGGNAAWGGTWTPDATLQNPQLHQRIYEIGRRYCETNFDPDANLVGANAKKPPNKKQHVTRESAYYAYGLLLTGDAADRTRAEALLRGVLSTQDTKPQSPTYGAYKWYVEEAQIQDSNSAAFVGLTLAGVLDLDRKHPVLPPELRKKTEDSVRMAVEAVLRRDVEAGYTNIAILSTALAAAGEKLLAVPGAKEFAQKKLDGILELVGNGDGEVSEYLSPTYYGVTLMGGYMSQRFAFSDDFAKKAGKLLDRMWTQIAASYHAPTYQLAGPHLRAYGENMLDYAAGLKYFLYFALNGDYPMPDTDKDHEWDKGGLVTIADLPIEPRAEFKKPVETWRQWNAVGSGTTPLRQLRQYREGNFVLGTVAFQDEWRQKRNLVAYWRNENPDPKKIDVGMCIDESNETLAGGFPGEKINFFSQQVKDSALVMLTAAAVIPGYGSCSTLVFNKEATASGGKDGQAMIIRDGAITTYLYPVANVPVSFAAQADNRLMRVTRMWDTADAVGTKKILAYLVVFRGADKAPPKVSGASLKVVQGAVVASIKVDGTELKVEAK